MRAAFGERRCRDPQAGHHRTELRRRERIDRWRLIRLRVCDSRHLRQRGAVLAPDRVVIGEHGRLVTQDDDDGHIAVGELVAVAVGGEDVVGVEDARSGGRDGRAVDDGAMLARQRIHPLVLRVPGRLECRRRLRPGRAGPDRQPCRGGCEPCQQRPARRVLVLHT